ncbi:MAG: HAD family hydrolase [Bacteriovorax sp.]|nr:HAD family hydrolase [Bacteriovorax sp.]
MTKINSKDFDFVIFDFDGVLVNSTPLKTQIFLDSISEFSEKEKKEFIEYHKFHGGVSRWGKFDYFLRNIIKLENENEIKSKTELLVSRFTTFIADALELLELTEGSLSLLQTLKKTGKKCFIVSGAAETEVQAIVKRTNIEEYFEAVLGSPKNKKQNLNSLKEHGKIKGKGIFIGDSYTDYQSAIDFKMNFIFMKDFTEWEDRKDVEDHFYLTVGNLNELNNIITKDNEARK